MFKTSQHMVTAQEHAPSHLKILSNTYRLLYIIRSRENLATAVNSMLDVLRIREHSVTFCQGTDIRDAINPIRDLSAYSSPQSEHRN